MLYGVICKSCGVNGRTRGKHISPDWLCVNCKKGKKPIIESDGYCANAPLTDKQEKALRVVATLLTPLVKFWRMFKK